MNEPFPKLDPQIVNQIYDGETGFAVLEKTAQKYASVSYPPRITYLHSLLIHSIRARRLDLVRICFEQSEYSPKRIRQFLGHHLQSPLWEAFLVGDQDIFEYLLERESNMTEQFDIRIGERRSITSPLRAAIKADNFRLFLKLFEAQQRREPSKLIYCLHEACADGSADLIRKMIEDERISLDINKLNSSGHSPLCIAAWHNPDFIPVLLGAGANPNVKCKDGKTALNTLCKAICNGRTKHTQVRALQLVKCLLNSETEAEDSSRYSPLRQLISVSDFVVDQNRGNLATEYRDIIALISAESCQESKALSLQQTVSGLYYILCGCLAQRTDSAKLSASLSRQRQQILFWLQKINVLTESGAEFDTSYWIRILASVVKANRANGILFTNLQFVGNYRFCLGVIHEVLRRLPTPCHRDPERSAAEEVITGLATDQPNLYLRLLCVFMESSTTSCNVVLCQRLLTGVSNMHALNNRQQFIAVLEFLSERVWTLKYIAKKNIIALMKAKHCVAAVHKLPLPNDLRSYLVEDEIKWDNI